jgi:hypothetical protein
VAQSVRKLPTLRYATGISWWRRVARRLFSVAFMLRKL